MKELGFSELNIGQGNGIILVKAEVEYKAELFHGDNIKVYVRISEVKNTSFIMEYLIEKEPDIVAAKGKTVLVSFNYEGRSITRVPDKFREKVETYQKK
jgi:acyl-CoA thioester hydrolase